MHFFLGAIRICRGDARRWGDITCGYLQLVDHHGVPKGPPRNFRLISARLDGYNYDFVSLVGGSCTFSSQTSPSRALKLIVWYTRKFLVNIDATGSLLDSIDHHIRCHFSSSPWHTCLLIAALFKTWLRATKARRLGQFNKAGNVQGYGFCNPAITRGKWPISNAGPHFVVRVTGSLQNSIKRKKIRFVF